MIAVRSCTSRSSSVPSHAPPSALRRQEMRRGLLIPSIMSLMSGSFPSRSSRNSIRSHCGAALKRSTFPKRRDSGATAMQSIVYRGGWKMEDRGWKMEDGGSTTQSIGRWRTEGLGLVDHAVEHGTDSLPLRVKFCMAARVDVGAIEGMIEPRLCLHRLAESLVDLIRERRRIASSCPAFRRHRVDRARRASHLVCQ